MPRTCTAIIKSTGKKCTHPALKGKRKCGYHAKKNKPSVSVKMSDEQKKVERRASRLAAALRPMKGPTRLNPDVLRVVAEYLVADDDHKRRLLASDITRFETEIRKLQRPLEELTGLLADEDELYDSFEHELGMTDDEKIKEEIRKMKSKATFLTQRISRYQTLVDKDKAALEMLNTRVAPQRLGRSDKGS